MCNALSMFALLSSAAGRNDSVSQDSTTHKPTSNPNSHLQHTDCIGSTSSSSSNASTGARDASTGIRGSNTSHGTLSSNPKCSLFQRLQCAAPDVTTLTSTVLSPGSDFCLLHQNPLGQSVIQRHGSTEQKYVQVNRTVLPQNHLRPKTWIKIMDGDRINEALANGCHCQSAYGGLGTRCGSQFSFAELYAYRLKRARMGEAERKELLLQELITMGAETNMTMKGKYAINGKRCCRDFFGAAGDQTHLLKVSLPLARQGFVKVTSKQIGCHKTKEAWTYAVLFIKFSQVCDKTQVSTDRAGRPGLKGRNWHLPMYIRVGDDLVPYVEKKWQDACLLQEETGMMEASDPPRDKLIRRVITRHFPYVHWPSKDDFSRSSMRL